MNFLSRGSLHIRVGPMFSGKTTWLNNELTALADKGFNVCKIIPIIDCRTVDGPQSLSGTTHNSSPGCLSHKITVFPTDSNDPTSFETLNVDRFDVIGIDEAQFYRNFVNVVTHWVDKENKHIRISGLDGDYNRKIFGDLYNLLPIADTFVKLQSTCSFCLRENYGAIDPFFFSAPFTHKLTNTNTTQIDVGGAEKYVPLCRYHYLNITQP